MELKAVLIGAGIDWHTKNLQLQLETETDIRYDLEAFYDKPLRVKLTKWKDRRSTDANAYYWQLLSKLADVLEVSKSFLHNTMLRQYGQPETIDGCIVYVELPDTIESEKKADEAETYHVKPTAHVDMGADGGWYRTYILLRGSSTYDSAEMATLINGLISECRDCGIPTETPDEIEHMLSIFR